MDRQQMHPSATERLKYSFCVFGIIYSTISNPLTLSFPPSTPYFPQFHDPRISSRLAEQMQKKSWTTLEIQFEIQSLFVCIHFPSSNLIYWRQATLETGNAAPQSWNY